MINKKMFRIKPYMGKSIFENDELTMCYYGEHYSILLVIIKKVCYELY